MELHEKNLLWFEDNKENLQGNIHRSHGREHTRLLFFQFNEENLQQTIDLLSGSLKKLITSADKQGMQSREWRSEGTKSNFMGFYLTPLGYEYLGKPFPVPCTDQTVGFDEPIHCMLLLAHDNKKELDNREKNYRDLFTDKAGASLIARKAGSSIRTNGRKSNYPIDHFGFADGISNPDFFKGKTDANYDLQSDIENYFVEEHTGSKTYGSCLVFMDLEQDVNKFEETENQLKTALTASGYGDLAELAAAHIIGRDRNGVPLADMTKKEETEWNDFTYGGSEGWKCPFAAHIRKMNDRLHGANRDISILRRGITYGKRGNVKYSEQGQTEVNPNVGLYFMSFQKSFDVFEAQLQKTNDSPENPGIDPLIGYMMNQRQPRPHFKYIFPTANEHIKQKGISKGSMPSDKGFLEIEAPAGFVSLKSRLDLFAPSLKFFENLQNIDTAPV